MRFAIALALFIITSTASAQLRIKERRNGVYAITCTKQSDSTRYALYDATGTLLEQRSWKWRTWVKVFHCRKLAPGNYVIEINGEKGVLVKR